jgi:hypothetical protein
MPQQKISSRYKGQILQRSRTCIDKLPKYHMRILLGDFNAKVGREDIFKPTIGNDSLHEIIIIMELE